MLHFVAGLPRSGSTLLCNILAQRESTLVTPTSPLPGMLRMLRDHWRGWHMTQPGFDRDASLIRVLRGVTSNYHHPGHALVIDKSREWPSLIETLESAMERPVRIVATVRELPQVAASMEMMWRRNLGLGRVPAQLANDTGMATTHSRVQRWISPGDVIGRAISVLNDAFARNLGDRIHLVNYKDLTERPREILDGIQEFLEIGSYDHNFNEVKQTTVEDDEWHGYSGLHDIREKVEPQEDRSEAVLGTQLRDQLSEMVYPWDSQRTASGQNNLMEPGV